MMSQQAQGQQSRAGTMPMSVDPGGRSGWIVSIGVSLVALVTLALVPVFLERQHTELQAEITVLSNVLRSIPEVRLAHSDQMMSVERYVDTGDSSFVTLYREDFLKEQDHLRELGQEVARLAPSYRRELAGLLDHITEWQVLHSLLMDEGVLRMSPADFRGSMEGDRARYATVEAAARAFEDSLIGYQLVVRLRLERQQILQFWATFGAIALAIAGAVAMMTVARRLQRLARSETQRRLETVAARREMRAVLGGTGDGLIGLDLESRCTFLNEAGARLLGYTPRELRNRPVHALIHHTRSDGSEHPDTECAVHRSLESGETIQVLDDVLWRKDGTSFPVKITASPMKDGLEVRGVVLTFSDMTETREAEQALRNAVRARDEVLAVVSHDLRNPVGTIAAAAELLMDVPVTPERRMEHLDMIRRSAERINRLIQDLLDVAQIEAGQLSVRLAPMDVKEVLEEAVALAGLRAGDEAVRLRCQVPPDLPLADADRDRILQVMSNLIGNAIKFTPEGGEITASASADADGVLVEVQDTGPGIAPEMLGHLFDRFWKGHRSAGAGAGLGLAIVKGILDAHQAEIRVDSEVGRGSTFSFALPLHSGAGTVRAPFADVSPGERLPAPE